VEAKDLHSLTSNMLVRTRSPEFACTRFSTLVCRVCSRGLPESSWPKNRSRTIGTGPIVAHYTTIPVTSTISLCLRACLLFCTQSLRLRGEKSSLIASASNIRTMAPRSKKSRSRNSEIRKHSHLGASIRPYLPTSRDRDDSVSEEGDYPKSSSMITEAKPPNSKSDNFDNLDFSDEECDEADVGSSGISSGVSSGGWSEGHSTTSSSSNNADDLRSIEKTLYDSTGDGLDLISDDALEEDDNDHHNSATALSLTMSNSKDSYASPKVAPANIVSFGENSDLSPIMMGGSEDAAGIRAYDPRYEGSLSDLMGFGNDNDNEDVYDSDEDDSAPMAGNYLASKPGSKRSQQSSRGPNPLLKPNVLARPPTPPSPKKRSHKGGGVNAALPSFPEEPQKEVQNENFGTMPVEKEKISKSKKASKSDKKKKSNKHDTSTKLSKGESKASLESEKKRVEKSSKLSDATKKKKKSVEGKPKIPEVEIEQLDDNTICGFCGDDMAGAELGKCPICKDAYCCRKCQAGKLVRLHEKQCAAWKANGYPSDSKPTVPPKLEEEAAEAATEPMKKMGEKGSKKAKRWSSRDEHFEKHVDDKVKRRSSSNAVQRRTSDGSGLEDLIEEAEELFAADVKADPFMPRTVPKKKGIPRQVDDSDEFSFDGIPEFEEALEDAKPAPAPATKPEKPQRKMSRAQRSLAFLFGNRTTLIADPEPKSQPDGIIEEETSDDESYYNNAAAETTSTSNPDLSKNQTKGNNTEEFFSDSIYNDDSSSSDSLMGSSTAANTKALQSRDNSHLKPPSSVLPSFEDIDETSVAPEEFHDEPLQQHRDSVHDLPSERPVRLKANNHGPEEFQDEPLQHNSREIPFGNDDTLDRKSQKKRAAEARRHERELKREKERRLERRLFIALGVALFCVMLATAAVVGGFVALAYFGDEDELAAPTSTPVEMPTSAPVPPPVNDEDQPNINSSSEPPNESIKITTAPKVEAPTAAPVTAPTTLAPTTPAPSTSAPTPGVAVTSAPVIAPTTLAPTTLAPSISALTPGVTVTAAPVTTPTTGTATLELPTSP